MEMGEGKRKSRQIAQQTQDLLLTFTREMSQLWRASHPRWPMDIFITACGVAWPLGKASRNFLSFFFFPLLAWEASYLHGRVLISSKMSLRNRAGQVCQGSKSQSQPYCTQGVNILPAYFVAILWNIQSNKQMFWLETDFTKETFTCFCTHFTWD